MAKSAEAFRTISEVAEWLDVQTHVLRFWESKFTQVKPVKRAGGRRYYRPNDMALLAGIRMLLHDDGVTIRGVQKILREKGVKHVVSLCDRPLVGMEDHDSAANDAPETRVSESESGKIIPMQPVGNIANLFDSSDTQAPEKVAKPEEPEPMTLFSHRAEPAEPMAEPEVETKPAAEPAAPAEEPVPSFAHALSGAKTRQEEPSADEADAPIPPAETSAETASPEPDTPPAVEIELPAASPISGPALAAAATAAAHLTPENLISRADRLAPAARRLQELHARMTNRSS